MKWRNRSSDLAAQLRKESDSRAQAEFFVERVKADLDVMRAELEVEKARAASVDILREEIQRLHQQVDHLLTHIVKLTTPQQFPSPAVFAPMDEEAEDAAWLARRDPNFDPNSPEVREIVEAAGLTKLLDQTGALSSDIQVAE